MAIRDEWITPAEAVELSGFQLEYVRMLCRKGRLETIKASRDWLIRRSSLEAHLEKMRELGRGKFDSWAQHRPDLAARGQGRQRKAKVDR